MFPVICGYCLHWYYAVVTFMLAVTFLNAILDCDSFMIYGHKYIPVHAHLCQMPLCWHRSVTFLWTLIWCVTNILKCIDLTSTNLYDPKCDTNLPHLLVCSNLCDYYCVHWSVTIISLAAPILIYVCTELCDLIQVYFHVWVHWSVTISSCVHWSMTIFAICLLI